MGRTWLGYAELRRILLLPPEGLRAKELGSPHELHISLADAADRATLDCLGRSWIFGLYELHRSTIDALWVNSNSRRRLPGQYIFAVSEYSFYRPDYHCDHNHRHLNLLFRNP